MTDQEAELRACDCYAVVGHHNGCASRYAEFPAPKAPAAHLFTEAKAEAWDEAIQLADDEGCLLYHQAKGLKAANPYRAAQRNEEA